MIDIRCCTFPPFYLTEKDKGKENTFEFFLKKNILNCFFVFASLKKIKIPFFYLLQIKFLKFSLFPSIKGNDQPTRKYFSILPKDTPNFIKYSKDAPWFGIYQRTHLFLKISLCPLPAWIEASNFFSPTQLESNHGLKLKCWFFLFTAVHIGQVEGDSMLWFRWVERYFEKKYTFGKASSRICPLGIWKSWVCPFLEHKKKIQFFPLNFFVCTLFFHSCLLLL